MAPDVLSARRMKRFFLLSFFIVAIAGCGGGTDDGGPTSAPPPASTSNGTPDPNQKTDPAPSSPSTPTSSACDPSKPCIEADVTMTDGSTFHFAHEAIMSKSEGAIGIRAVDTKGPFGITLTFKPGSLTAGQSYPSEVSGAVWMSIYRKHPTEDGKTRLSSAQFGSIVFTQTGATSAESAAGTFDGVAVIRNEPDDNTNIKLTKGTFRAGAL